MKCITKTVGLATALWLSIGAGAQVPDAESVPDRAATIKAARHVMQQARYCGLITIGSDGQPQARVVDPFPPEEDFVVWLATNPKTRKVAQIRHDPRVTLYYFDPADPGYVTLFGRAELVDAPEEKAKRWKEEWSSFYNENNKGSDYMLIRVTPYRIEVVSYSQGLVNDSETWAPESLSLP
jgi:PPOX class probable F420-dependent enzyme